VKALSERIQTLQQDSQTQLEMVKTEYEIKVLELEQRLGGEVSESAELAAQTV